RAAACFCGTLGGPTWLAWADVSGARPRAREGVSWPRRPFGSAPVASAKRPCTNGSGRTNTRPCCPSHENRRQPPAAGPRSRSPSQRLAIAEPFERHGLVEGLLIASTVWIVQGLAVHRRGERQE